jgi:hypothetical protein
MVHWLTTGFVHIVERWVWGNQPTALVAVDSYKLRQSLDLVYLILYEISLVDTRKVASSERPGFVSGRGRCGSLVREGGWFSL